MDNYQPSHHPRYEYKKNLRHHHAYGKYASLFGLLVILVLLPVSIFAVKTGIQLILGAQTQQVMVYLTPESSTLTSTGTFKLLASSETNKVGFIDAEITFDRTKLSLDSEITPSNKLATIITKTSRADANATGKVMLTLGLRPEDKALAPSGIFELASLTFRKVGTGTTTINVNGATLQAVSSTGSGLSTEGANASVTLSTTATATPAPTSGTQPTGSNMLTNPSFETNPNTNYFTHTDGGGTFIHSAGYRTGAHSVKIVSTQSNTNLHRWLSNNGSLQVQAGTQYEGRVWVRTVNLTGKASLSLTFWGPTANDNLGPSVASSQITGNNDWTELVVRGTAPTGAKYIRFEMRMVGAGTVYFDDASLVQAGGSTTPTQSTNLISNSGFESDPRVQYDTHGTATYAHATDQKYAGSRSVKITSNLSSTSSLTRWFYKNGTLSVIPGRTYEASVWVKTQSVSGNANLTLNMWGPGAYDYISGRSSSSVSGTSSWRKVSVTFTAPSNAKYARLELRLFGPGSVWFDEASVIQK